MTGAGERRPCKPVTAVSYGPPFRRSALLQRLGARSQHLEPAHPPGLPVRTGGRVVEGARLESVYTGNRIAGATRTTARTPDFSRFQGLGRLHIGVRSCPAMAMYTKKCT